MIDTSTANLIFRVILCLLLLLLLIQRLKFYFSTTTTKKAVETETRIIPVANIILVQRITDILHITYINGYKEIIECRSTEDAIDIMNELYKCINN